MHHGGGITRVGDPIGPVEMQITCPIPERASRASAFDQSRSFLVQPSYFLQTAMQKLKAMYLSYSWNWSMRSPTDISLSMMDRFSVRVALGINALRVLFASGAWRRS